MLKRLRATPTGELREEERARARNYYRSELNRRLEEIRTEQKREMTHKPEDTITYAELETALKAKGYSAAQTGARELFDVAKDAREPKHITPDELRAALAKHLESSKYAGGNVYLDQRVASTPAQFTDVLLADIQAARKPAPAQSLPPVGTIVRVKRSGVHYRKTATGWQPANFADSNYPDLSVDGYEIIALPVPSRNPE